MLVAVSSLGLFAIAGGFLALIMYYFSLDSNVQIRRSKIRHSFCGFGSVAQILRSLLRKLRNHCLLHGIHSLPPYTICPDPDLISLLEVSASRLSEDGSSFHGNQYQSYGYHLLDHWYSSRCYL